MTSWKKRKVLLPLRTGMVVFPRIVVTERWATIHTYRRRVPPHECLNQTNPFCITLRTPERRLWRAADAQLRLKTLNKSHLKKGRGSFNMTKSVRLMLMGAALTGFVAGQNAFAQDTATKDETKKADSGKKADKKAKTEKHACKGQNSCKGKGGCGETKGKNDCKGQGGCSTDPKHPMPK
jgi:hypothetical protein